MKEPAQSYDRNTYKVIKKEQTNNPIKHLVKTHEGLYTFCKKYVYLNNKKVTKFTGKITQIINQSDLLICADKNGSIKVINKRVIKRFELGKEIKSLCSNNDKIFVVDNESAFYVFSLFENDFIFKKAFKNILSLQCNDNKVILCTKKELIFLNEEFKKIKSFKMKNKKNKLFFKNNNLIFIYKNKIKILNLKTKLILKKSVHTKKIKKIELHNDFIYSLGKDNFVKKLDYNLNILERHFFNKITDFDFRNELFYSTKESNILQISFDSSTEFIFPKEYKDYFKKYMFKKALVTSFTTEDTELKLKVMKFIIDNDKLQCALYDHFYFDIKKFLIFMIENWDCSYKETFILFINFIFKEYQRFLPELVDEFESVYQIIFEEFYLQQELNVLISYFESFD